MLYRTISCDLVRRERAREEKKKTHSHRAASAFVRLSKCRDLCACCCCWLAQSSCSCGHMFVIFCVDIVYVAPINPTTVVGCRRWPSSSANVCTLLRRMRCDTRTFCVRERAVFVWLSLEQHAAPHTRTPHDTHTPAHTGTQALAVCAHVHGWIYTNYSLADKPDTSTRNTQHTKRVPVRLCTWIV